MTLAIALLGTENTHGHQFAGYINGWSHEVAIPVRTKHGFMPRFLTWAKTLREAENDPEIPVPAPDARVTSIWCPDGEGAALVAHACGIKRLAPDPLAALEGADAALILTEDAASHVKLATAALSRGIPTFVDKPLAPDRASSNHLAALAREKGVPWFTGSAFRFSPSLHRFRSQLPETAGSPIALYVGVPGPLEYYGIHALEIANALVPLVGEVALQAFRVPGRSGAILTLESSISVIIECLEVVPEPPGHAIVYGAKALDRWESNDGSLAMLGLVTAFLDMVRTRTSPIEPEEGLRLAELARRVSNTAERAGEGR